MNVRPEKVIAIERLPEQLMPEDYSISLAINIPELKTDGHVSITGRKLGSDQMLTLHFKDMLIHEESIELKWIFGPDLKVPLEIESLIFDYGRETLSIMYSWPEYIVNPFKPGI